MGRQEAQHKLQQDIEPSCKVNRGHLNQVELLWWMLLSGYIYLDQNPYRKVKTTDPFSFFLISED